MKITKVCCSWRYGIAYIGFIGMMMMYSVRLNLSLAIVCMVKSTKPSTVDLNITLENETSFRLSANSSYLTLGEKHDGEACADVLGVVNASGVEGTFEWSRSLQGTVLSSYFYGYIATQFPGGWLAKRFGSKITIGVGTGIGVVCTLLAPIAARTSVYFLIAVRIILGAGSGLLFPSFHNLWSNWAPVLERTKLVSICYAGTIFGNIVTFFLSGYLCEYGFDGGWPSIFYISGLVQFLWLILFICLVSDSPSRHRFISQQEKEYISESIGTSRTSQKDMSIPWKSLFSSPPLLAIMVAQFCFTYGQYTLMVCLPTFMKDVLKFDMRQNGLYSALPYVLMIVCTISVGQIADILRQRKVKTVVVRKVFQVLGFVLPAIFLVGAGFIDCQNRMVAVGLVITSVGLASFSKAGYLVNHLDIAPRFAGVMFGISNTFAAIPGMVAPLVVGQLTTNGEQEEWQIVFYICAGLMLFGAIFYSIFASGEVQDWAKERSHDTHSGAELDHLNEENGLNP